MIFTNIHTLTILLFLFVIIILSYYIFYSIKNNTNIFEVVFLSISIFCLAINIFALKWWLNKSNDEIFGSRIVFALDVSKSMNALDYRKGNNFISRLDASKNIIYDSLKEWNEYGLVIFSGESLEVLPFSSDLWLFKTIVSSVDDKNISKHGTDLWELFLSTTDFFASEDEWGLVVILTDGWDEEEDIVSNSTEVLQEKNIWVVFVWMWNRGGSYIPASRDLLWNIIYKTYEGKKVVTKLNESKLKNITDKYDFDYFRFEDLADFDSLDYFISSRLDLVAMQNDIESRSDLTRWFALISFIFFILYLIFSQFLWKRY